MAQTSTPNTPDQPLQRRKQGLCRSDEAERRLHDSSSSSLFNNNPVRNNNKPQNESRVCHHQKATTTTQPLLINKTKLTRGHQYSNTLLNNLIYNLFNLLIVNTVLSHLNQLNYIIKTSTLDNNSNQNNFLGWRLTIPNIISARKLSAHFLSEKKMRLLIITSYFVTISIQHFASDSLHNPQSLPTSQLYRQHVLSISTLDKCQQFVADAYLSNRIPAFKLLASVSCLTTLPLLSSRSKTKFLTGKRTTEAESDKECTFLSMPSLS